MALGASCALHAAAAAWLPGIGGRAPSPLAQPLTVALEMRETVVAGVQAQQRPQAPPVSTPKRSLPSRAPTVPKEPVVSTQHDAPAASVPVPAIAESTEPGSPLPAPTVVAAVAPSTALDAVPAGPKIELPRFDVAYLRNPPPAYPAIARRMRLEGTVVLRVLVDALGRSEEHTSELQ